MNLVTDTFAKLLEPLATRHSFLDTIPSDVRLRRLLAFTTILLGALGLLSLLLPLGPPFVIALVLLAPNFCLLILFGVIAWFTLGHSGLRFAILSERFALLNVVVSALILALLMSFVVADRSAPLGLVLMAIELLLAVVASLFWFFLSSRWRTQQIHAERSTQILHELASMMLMNHEERLPNGTFNSLVLTVANGAEVPIVALLTNRRLIAISVLAPNLQKRYELNCSLMRLTDLTEALAILHQGTLFELRGDLNELKRLRTMLMESVWYDARSQTPR